MLNIYHRLQQLKIISQISFLHIFKNQFSTNPPKKSQNQLKKEKSAISSQQEQKLDQSEKLKSKKEKKTLSPNNEKGQQTKTNNNSKKSKQDSDSNTSTIPKNKQFTRRDRLIEFEKQAQKLWEDNKVHEANVQQNAKKYFLTFPYPYLNGRLHMGHVFTLSKADFASRFARLSNLNVLFPFGFHCTGMPICAAADKLKQELQIKEKLPQKDNQDTRKSDTEPIKLKQYEIMKKLNVPEELIPKFTDPYYWTTYFPQFAKNDLKSFGAAIDWRRSFITTDINPYYDSFIKWQFTHLKERGYIVFGKRPSIYCIKDDQMCADHDRSEGEGVGPQEYTLIKLQLQKFRDNVEKQQSSNINIQKIIQILQEQKDQKNNTNNNYQKKKIYLVAATLRPETMYGQTNCFVQPEGQYGAYLMRNNEVFICSEHSIRNMAFQALTQTDKKIEKIADLKGTDLIGAALKAPLAMSQNQNNNDKHQSCVYALPMMNVLMQKGTGIVTSVPSDAPDDWAALRDLQKKSALRQKYDIDEEIIKNLQPISIIDIPSIGNLAAVKTCEEFGIQSQNDREKLAKAKEKCYLLGFSEGIMKVGKYAGKKVQEVKQLVRQELIDNGQAVIYYEPEDNIVSRSGDKCIVALCDQWYLKYSDEEWKKDVRDYVKNANTFKSYNQIAHSQFIETVDWLKDWGCSRTYGLGTRLPFDSKYLIESLSDSTIYMAYYAISHYLQGDIRGSTPGKLGINASQMTKGAWDYVFLGKQYNKTTCLIPEEKLKIMKEEFQYWYPLDLRVSAKDLIRNHLTMSLFNHAAIWKRKNTDYDNQNNNQVKNGSQLWPQSFFVNGYILVNGAKMSKEKGNFFTVEDMVKKYGADATRFALAEAGDTVEDANFTEQNADEAVLKISTLEMWLKNVAKQIKDYRKDSRNNQQLNFFDKAFETEMKELYCQTLQNYREMKFRDVCKSGFHEFHIIKENYLLNCDKDGPCQNLIIQWIEWQLALFYPIAPHFCEIAFKEYFSPLIVGEQLKFNKTSKYLYQYRYQEINQSEIDKNIIKSYRVLRQFLRNLRLSWQKVKAPKIQAKSTKIKKQDQQLSQQNQQQFSQCLVVYAQDFHDWQKQVFTVLSEFKKEDNKNDWKQIIKNNKNISQDLKKKQLQFGQFTIDQAQDSGLQLQFKEQQILQYVKQTQEDLQLIMKNQVWITKETGIQNIRFIELKEIVKLNEKLPESAIKDIVPGKFQIIFL